MITAMHNSVGELDSFIPAASTAVSRRLVSRVRQSSFVNYLQAAEREMPSFSAAPTSDQPSKAGDS